jgi:hypothetical protein
MRNRQIYYRAKSQTGQELPGSTKGDKSYAPNGPGSPLQGGDLLSLTSSDMKDKALFTPSAACTRMFQALSVPFHVFMLFFICSLSLYGSGDSLMQVVSDRFTRLNESYRQEKLYIHTDKSHYLPGETVWFSLYLVDASSLEPSPQSRIVYIELADTPGMVADRRYIAITNGRGHGDFMLDPGFEPGTWILRGFTHYMLNFANTPLFSMELRVMNWSEANGNGTRPADDPDGRSPAAGNDTGSGAVRSSRSEANDNGYMAGGARKEDDGDPSGELSREGKITVRFFPEGGDLVGGLMASIAVQSVGHGGRGIEVHGQVYDDLGSPAGSFATGRFGLGRFMFTPLPGRNYHAVVESGEKTLLFELPLVTANGYTLQVNNSMPDETLVRMETNMDGGLQGAFLAGHTRGRIFCLKELSPGDLAFVYVDKIGFPPGIVHFTLFSAEGLPVAERLVFMGNEENSASLDISVTKETYGKREKVEIGLELTDYTNYLQGGNFSVSVTDSYVVPSHHEHHNILSFLLLSSDLPGNIENPGYFFDTSNADRNMLLDLLMMTHGWRRFKWDDLLAGNFPEILYPAGTGHIIRGKITYNERHNVPMRSRVMFATLGEEFSAASQVTGEDGLFLFDRIELYDTTILVLQASVYNERRARRLARRGIDESFAPGSNNRVLLHISEPDIVPGRPDIPAASISGENFAAYVEDSMKDPILSHLEDIWQLEIEGVEIQRRRPVRRTTFDRAIHGIPFRPKDRIIVDEHPFSQTFNNPWELLRAVHPAVFTDTETKYTGQPKGPRPTGQPTSLFFSTKSGIFLNGIEVSSDIIEALPVESISFIDILRQPQTNIYGMGYSMVIAVYTKTAGEHRDAGSGPTGVLSFEFPGYYRAREFYSPVYDVPGPHHTRPDYRTTLFWDPEIQIDGYGKAEVSFFTSDKSSAFRVIVEGVTQTGIPVYASGEFRVETDEPDH